MEMSFYWNREVKRLTVMFIMILILGILCSNMAIDRYCNMMNREFNLAVASILDSVKRVYPEIPEEEVMRLLGGNEKSGEGERLLGQYGVFLDEKGSAFAGLAEKKTGFYVISAVVFLFTGGSFLAVLLIYLRCRQREIGKLCRYMDEVRRGNFSLDVSHNRDDELSSLKNELYKLTIFLKEQAKMATDNRMALADAVADICIS